MERENSLSLEQQAKLEELKERWKHPNKSLEEYRSIFREAKRAEVFNRLLADLTEETFTTEFG